MRLDLRDPVAKSIYLYGCYEYPVTRLISAILRPGMVFFDIGANAGFFSLLASTKCKAVYAFEPLPSNLHRLSINLELNATQNVTVVQSAVTDRSGTGTLYVPEDENTGLASLIEETGGHSIAVPTITLDEFVRKQGIGRVDLIKIDIEGAEALAFEGAQELLSRVDAPDVIFEAKPGSEAANRLQSCGYTIYEFKLQREWEAPNLFASKKEFSHLLARQVQKQVSRA